MELPAIEVRVGLLEILEHRVHHVIEGAEPFVDVVPDELVDRLAVERSVRLDGAQDVLPRLHLFGRCHGFVSLL